MKNYKVYITIFLFIIAAFLSVFKLRESPPTWMDEGIIIQTARSFADIGYPAIPVAPGIYESAGTITTSYTVTLPVAMSFKMFGVGLIQARLIPVIYLFLIFIAVFFLIKKFISTDNYLICFALFVTFPPLYGQGKNVLGEVPGIFFFILFLILVYIYERKEYKNYYIVMLAGLTGGLFVATKPIFILFLPAIFFAYIVKRFWYKDFVLNIKEFLIFIISMLVPILMWIVTQFRGDSMASVFSQYSNPYKVDIIQMIVNNINLFYTEAQPIYFLILFGVWASSVVLMLYTKNKITFAELIAFLFSSLVFMAFFRTPGFYRYFFPAQLLALIFFIPSLENVLLKFGNINVEKRRKIIIFLFSFLFMVQLWGLFFTSWIARSYSSTKTEEMYNIFSNITNQNIFLYQVPEVATFLPVSSFYQFFYTAPQLAFGKKSLDILAQGIPEIVIVNSDIYLKNIDIFIKYTKIENLGRYSILRK